ncbi:hypothetical protein FE257_004454 [Aspergillus nanangensis]|uniref:Kelch repeat protein n=1 Tax=Aspergillus nanangensis TaxID=2582783 RepID=A0AAD4CYK4_ASPNN|nr:hypothetical protein FE257_004454 [Aspergillus nanangensis]
MAACAVFLLCVLSLQHAVVVIANNVVKRAALTDLSEGFCRSWKFGANIVNDVLYMIDLDGGIIPGDEDGSNNYLVELDLTSAFSTDDGSKYRMSLVDSSVPKLKDQALWSDKANTTLYSYGGRGASDTSADEGLWTYTIKNQEWKLQQASIKPVRLVGGAYTNAPDIQAAYWLGGYQSSDTTLSITDKTVDYAAGMIQFNTTTGVFTQLDAPFTPVQQGALVYIPVGEQGILVYVGGEVPSVQEGINATLTPNAWDYVQVYDIAADKWYKQTTTSSVSSRTEFCAVVEKDPSSSSYQVYVIGGADFRSNDVLYDVSYLSIPSFKWYRAGSLDEGRMSLTCAPYGRQIFGIGGRLAWADDSEAGCYDMPAFVYDSVSEVVREEFDPALSIYSVPSATADDIHDSPYPASWADPALASLFISPTNSTNSTGSASKENKDTGVNKGPIIGGVVGGVVGALMLLALIFAFIWYRRRKGKRQGGYPAEVQLNRDDDNLVGVELPAQSATSELEGSTERSELMAGEVHELDGGGSRIK